VKTSWKFFAGFLSGLLLVLVVYYQLVLFQLGAKTETSRWTAEIIEKKMQAVEAIHQPKLLVLGGSASHFGVTAAELERLTGMTCVNGATFAGLGPVYILEIGKKMARPGDTILLILEYEMFLYDINGKPYMDENLIDFILSRDPKYFENLGWDSKFRLLNTVSINRVKRGLRVRKGEEDRWENAGVYQAQFLNSQGDQQGHVKAVRPPNRAAIGLLNFTLAKGLLSTNAHYPHVEEFCRWAHAHNIRVIATYPNLSQHQDYTPAQVQEIDRVIRNIYKSYDVPVVGSANEAIYPQEFFFDTMYHLTQEGSMIRSADLARQLGPLLGKP
jgi:hypothetical protein